MRQEAGSYPRSSHVDPYELPLYISAIQKEWETIPCGPKGEIERFLERGAGFFPDRLLIPRMIVQTNEIESIRNGLVEGVTQNASMGVRAIADRKLFGGEKLPWDMEITTIEKVNNFIKETLPQWKYAALKNRYTISQLILMYNPPEIGTKATLTNQFVARVQKDDIIPPWSKINNAVTNEILWSRVLMEMVTGTNMLRDMDRFLNESNTDVLRVQYSYGPTGVLKNHSTQIGLEKFEKETMSSIHLPNISGEHKDLTPSAIAKNDNIIRDPDFQKRLNFFSSIGLNAIEFQGYRDTMSGLVKIYIYGIRGPNDEATTVGFHPYDFESRSHSE